MVDATEWADAQVAAVRDDTAGRIALLKRTYHGRDRRLPYRRAALSFMRWQADRGLLEPSSAARPGSPWWRAVNERLLHDGCVSVASMRTGSPPSATSPTVELWLDFVREPSAKRWYRAHNASIVAAYIEHAALAETETEAERFFMNVALLRVLFAHALVAAPKLALGRFAPLAGILGDPRLGMAGAFLSLGRVLPDIYPLNGQLEQYLRTEHGLGRILDYAVIGPRLELLYRWSSEELHQPGLLELLRGGLPSYAWPAERSDVWRAPPPSFPARLLGAATSPRRRMMSS